MPHFARIPLLVAVPKAILRVLYGLGISGIIFVTVVLFASELALHEPASEFDFHGEVRRVVGPIDHWTLRQKQSVRLVEAEEEHRADNEGREDKSSLEHWGASI